MNTSLDARTESGFSLLELMVAMVVTLIVTGSIYGLMTTSNSAFRREPQLSERQQNIRIAMDLIQHDVALAGMGVAPMAMSFTPNLNGVGPVSPAGGNTDDLEVIGSSGECPALSAAAAPAASGLLSLTQPPPGCYEFPTIVAVNFPASFHLGFACSAPAANIQFPAAGSVLNWPGGDAQPDSGGRPATVNMVQMVKYRVRNDAVEGVPVLQRSPSGDIDTAGATGCGGAGTFNGGYQVVARGIEDMQVVYVMGDGSRVDSPPVLVAANPATIVREVNVTLVARAIGQNLEGQRAGAGATGTAVRQALTTSIVPRAALQALNTVAGGWE